MAGGAAVTVLEHPESVYAVATHDTGRVVISSCADKVCWGRGVGWPRNVHIADVCIDVHIN